MLNYIGFISITGLLIASLTGDTAYAVSVIGGYIIFKDLNK